METFHAILLGIVQGITEFLPVSSSGHLQIAKELLGVQLEENHIRLNRQKNNKNIDIRIILNNCFKSGFSR